MGCDLTGGVCTVIADAGRLPFRSESFDGVLSAAVLEHLPEPGWSLDEVRRVLRPSGKLFGYVAFLEPLHGMSYFHMSHLGLEYLLLRHGFRVERLYPSHNVLSYQLEQILFPKPLPVIQPLVRAIARVWAQGLLFLNRVGRGVLMVLRRVPRERRREEAREYRMLQAMRFAIGFNFISVRSDPMVVAQAGYRALLKGDQTWHVSSPGTRAMAKSARQGA